MASSNMTRPVRQKASDSEEEDRISNLPESILGLILSCLPTKHAVATCVLSKRWLYLWTCITALHFDDSLFPLHEAEKRINNFENFVSSVLLGLNNSSIQSFSLHVARKIDPSIANAWISTILKRGVKNLTISSPEKCDFINPIIPYPKNVIFLSRNNLFSCNSLVNLILNISCTVRLLASVHLPNLQNLELCGVKLMGESSGANKDMTLSFPVLKKFKAQILWLNMHSVTLQVPLLEVVDINCCSYDCIIKLCASRVREFSYVSYQSQYFILSDPSSALNASAYIRICNPIVSGDNELRRRACMLIRQFNQVKSLKLESIVGFGNTIESFVDLPTFEMLHHLKLRDVTRVKVLMVLLQKTPNLISLEIEVPYKLRLEDFAIVPDCFSTLKVVKFGNFGGYHNELRLVKYIMENAVALERLSFSPHREAKILRSFKKKMEDTVKLLYVMKGFNLTILDVSELLGD